MNHRPWIALACLAVGAVVLRRVGGRKAQGARDLNAEFHAAYDRRRALEVSAAPILVVLGESLVLIRGGRRESLAIKSEASQRIKAAAHAPVGIFVALSEEIDGAVLCPRTRERLANLRAALIQAGPGSGDLEPLGRADLEAVLRDSCAFIDRILANERASAGALSRFAAELGPLLLRLTEHATRLDFAALHRAAETLLGRLSERERGLLEVVVAGAHQARARNLALQYFQKRFGEAPGEERRVSYAEAVTDVSQASALVGTRRLDRAIASAFFRDAKRLQRDVLGDAATRLLGEASIARSLSAAVEADPT
jgi:hypothetical protein